MISLKKNWEFQRAYQKGKSKVTPYFVIYFIKNGKEGNQIGFTVSKKIGNAVKRNKARRRLKEAVRASQLQKIGYDIVIVARQKALTIDYSELKKLMQSELSKIVG